MSKKKKERKAKPKQRDTQKVEARWKEALQMEPPDQNPYKMENEKLIEGFWRFNRRRHEKEPRKAQSHG